MDFIGHNREKKRKKRRRNLNKKHRDQIKSEVTFSKRKKLITETNSSNFVMKKKIVAMEANAFWENYKAAHEWQNRHNSTWWKARCFALEHENHLLKETIRKLANNQEFHKNISNKYEHNQQDNYKNVNLNSADNKDQQNEHFEFQMNEDMMNFLAQSIRHKIELKNKKNKSASCQEEDIGFGKMGHNVFSQVYNRSKDTKLLYGDATSRILAMETALQTTIDKHIDKSKPQYWPNIPLKL